jgi:iron(III) transport system ATP-binding protein
MAFIDIAGIDKRFGGFRALIGVDLAIAEREFITLLGPSGCGKTTMLRTLAGFLTPDTGTIEVGGRLLSSPQGVVPPEQRRMGMVFQNYAVWPHMSVFENVAFGLRIAKTGRGQIGERIERILAAVGLEGLEQRHPGQLSGGQQQRVALARSLVVEPAILLLDEPLSNLDAKLRERMRTELKVLQRRTGITFVYVTHDQAEALALSDMVAVIHGGRLQQYGTPHDVYSRPANRIVADFMGLVNLVPATVVAAKNGSGTVEAASALRLDLAMPDGTRSGDAVEIAIRPENIRLKAANGQDQVRATISERTFLGNVSEYYARLDSGQVLRVQTHPLQQFAVGEAVALKVDATQCSVFRPSDSVPQDGVDA